MAIETPRQGSCPWSNDELPGGSLPAAVAWLPAVPSLQFRVFRLGLLEDGDVRVGVLPKGEEVLVGRAGIGKGIGLGRPWAPGLGGHKARPYIRL